MKQSWRLHLKKYQVLIYYFFYHQVDSDQCSTHIQVVFVVLISKQSCGNNSHGSSIAIGAATIKLFPGRTMYLGILLICQLAKDGCNAASVSSIWFFEKLCGKPARKTKPISIITSSYNLHDPDTFCVTISIF